MSDRRVADVGDWSMGNECQAAIPSNQRCANDSSNNDHFCRFNATADCCHRRRRRHEKQTASASPGQALLLCGLALRAVSKVVGKTEAANTDSPSPSNPLNPITLISLS